MHDMQNVLRRIALSVTAVIRLIGDHTAVVRPASILNQWLGPVTSGRQPAFVFLTLGVALSLAGVFGISHMLGPSKAVSTVAERVSRGLSVLADVPARLWYRFDCRRDLSLRCKHSEVAFYRGLVDAALSGTAREEAFRERAAAPFGNREGCTLLARPAD